MDKHTIVYRLGIILIAICAAVVLVIAVTVGFWIKRCYYHQFERFVKGQAALSAHEQALHFACHGACGAGVPLLRRCFCHARCGAPGNLFELRP